MNPIVFVTGEVVNFDWNGQDGLLYLSRSEAVDLMERLEQLILGPTRRQCWFLSVRWYLDDVNGTVDIATPKIDEMLAEEYANGAWPDAAAELAILLWNTVEESEDGQADENGD